MPIGNRFKGRRKGPGPAYLAIISVGPFKRVLGSSSKSKGLIVITNTGFIELMFRLNQNARNIPAIIKLVRDVLDIR